MTEHYFFFIGLIVILIHEMDAVRHHEWKIIPGLSRLNDLTAYFVFCILHLPLYGFLFWALISNQINICNLAIGLDVFFVIHVSLHLLLSKHKENPFNNYFSWGLIILAGLFGTLDYITSNHF